MILSKLKENQLAIKTALICFIMATIPLKLNFSNLAFIIAVAFNVFFLKKNSLKKLKQPASFIPLLLFLILSISSLLSKSNYGIHRLGLELLAVYSIFIVVNFEFTKQNTLKIFKTFYLATVGSLIILLVIASFNYFKSFSVSSITFHNFTAFYDQHPVFYSMYLSLALFMSLNTALGLNKALHYISSVLLILGIVLCASKTIIAFNIIAFSIFFLSSKIKTIKKTISYLLLMIGIVIALYNVPFIKKRFIEGLTFQENITNFQPTNDFRNKKLFSYEEKEQISDLELRYLLAKIGLFHQKEDHKLLFGYGKGDSRDYLNYYLFSYNLGPNWYENFNLHNQYLDILFNMGIFTLFFFLGYLIYSFTVALKSKNKNHLFFLLLITVVFFFDAPLTINKGIVYFYFFNTLFIFNYLYFENSNIRN